MLRSFMSKNFFKYVIVGFIGTGLDFLILYLLVEFWHLFYLLAALISIGIVIWLSFTLNKFWTFKNLEKRYFLQLGKYILAHSVGIGINLAILTLLVEFFGLWYILAKVIATALALIWNFLVAKKWVFRGENGQNFNR